MTLADIQKAYSGGGYKMEVCKERVGSLSQESVENIFKNAPSVPTHDPDREYSNIVRSDSIQSQAKSLGTRSLSIETTSDASQDSYHIMDSSTAPSHTESTRASSLSQPGFATLQGSSTFSTTSSCQTQSGVMSEAVHMISAELLAKRPSLSHRPSRELAEHSKLMRIVLQGSANIQGLIQFQRKSPGQAQPSPGHSSIRDHDTRRPDPAMLPERGHNPQASIAQSSPRTEPSRSQGATSQLKPMSTQKLIQVSKGKHPLFRYEQMAYISPTMPMDQKVVDYWESPFKQRLEDAICQTIHDSTLGDSGLTIECLMAGRTESTLKPTIVVACSTEHLRRALVKQFKSFVWILESPLECMVINTPTAPLADTTSSGLSTGAIIAIVFSSTGALFLGLIRLWYYIRHSGRPYVARLMNSCQPRANRADEENFYLESSVKSSKTRYQKTTKSSHTTMPSSSGAADNTSEVVEDWHLLSTNRMTMSPTYSGSQSTKNRKNAPGDIPSESGAERLTKICDISIAPKEKVTLCAGLLKLSVDENNARTSTLGGLIMINKKVFGLTVAHALSSGNDENNHQEDIPDPAGECEGHLQDDDVSTRSELQAEVGGPQTREQRIEKEQAKQQIIEPVIAEEQLTKQRIRKQEEEDRQRLMDIRERQAQEREIQEGQKQENVEWEAQQHERHGLTRPSLDLYESRPSLRRTHSQKSLVTFSTVRSSYTLININILSTLIYV